MSRCIVFDQATADAVQAWQLGIRPEIRADQQGLIVDMAINSRAAVAVLPAVEPGNVLLVRLSRPQTTSRSTKVRSNVVPAGFLGLSDSIDMDSEPEQPQKWWQKIIG